jgi:selenocysteine lyase/cysteine desulfurase
MLIRKTELKTSKKMKTKTQIVVALKWVSNHSGNEANVEQIEDKAN